MCVKVHWPKNSFVLGWNFQTVRSAVNMNCERYQQVAVEPCTYFFLRAVAFRCTCLGENWFWRKKRSLCTLCRLYRGGGCQWPAITLGSPHSANHGVLFSWPVGIQQMYSSKDPSSTSNPNAFPKSFDKFEIPMWSKSSTDQHHTFFNMSALFHYCFILCL